MGREQRKCTHEREKARPGCPGCLERRSALRHGPADPALALALWATKAEDAGPMPGAEIAPKASFNATRAITIDAPPGRAWPWIVQMGYRRADFCTYARDRSAGGER